MGTDTFVNVLLFLMSIPSVLGGIPAIEVTTGNSNDLAPPAIEGTTRNLAPPVVKGTTGNLALKQSDTATIDSSSSVGLTASTSTSTSTSGNKNDDPEGEQVDDSSDTTAAPN